MKDAPTSAVFPAACPQCAIHRGIPASLRIGKIVECQHCHCRAYAADWVSQARRLMREHMRGDQ